MKMKKQERKDRSRMKALIVLIFLLVLTSCGEKNIAKKIAGVYYPVSCTDDEGIEYELEDEELHINEDGSGYFLFHDNMYELRWKYEDGVFWFEDSSEDIFEGTYKDKTITGRYFNDYNYIFKKKR